MSIAFSHISALEVLRYITAHGGCTSLCSDDLTLCELPRAGWRQLKSAHPTASEVFAANDGLHCYLTTPIHFMVAGRANQRRGKDVICHVYTKPPPPGALVRIGSGDLAASPELCLLQLASTASLSKTVQIGYELCGTYSIDAYASSGFTRRDPLTTPELCRSFMGRMAPRPGLQTARKAVELILPGSASPMETIVAMLLSFPRRLGGYGLPQPTLNAKVKAAGAPLRGGWSSGVRICDLYWPNHRVAVEYDSNDWHTGSDRISSDAIRRVTLENAGVKVISITNQQVRDRVRMDELARLLAKMLGVRLRSSADWVSRQIELRESLLATPSYGSGG